MKTALSTASQIRPQGVSVNREGRPTQPWATPHIKQLAKEAKPAKKTETEQLVRQEKSRERAVPWKPHERGFEEGVVIRTQCWDED